MPRMRSNRKVRLPFETLRPRSTSVGRSGDDWEKFIVLEGPIIKGGKIQIPDKPGLGVELNEDKIRANLFPGEQWWG